LDATNKDKTVVRFTYDMKLEKGCFPEFSTDNSGGVIGSCPRYDAGCNMDGVEWDTWKEGWERTFECHFDAISTSEGL